MVNQMLPDIDSQWAQTVFDMRNKIDDDEEELDWMLQEAQRVRALVFEHQEKLFEQEKLLNKKLEMEEKRRKMAKVSLSPLANPVNQAVTEPGQRISGDGKKSKTDQSQIKKLPPKVGIKEERETTQFKHQKKTQLSKIKTKHSSFRKDDLVIRVLPKENTNKRTETFLQEIASPLHELPALSADAELSQLFEDNVVRIPTKDMFHEQVGYPTYLEPLPTRKKKKRNKTVSI